MQKCGLNAALSKAGSVHRRGYLAPVFRAGLDDGFGLTLHHDGAALQPDGPVGGALHQLFIMGRQDDDTRV